MTRFWWVLATVALAGCTIGGRGSASQENERLRRRVIELEKEVHLARAERDELAAKLASVVPAIEGGEALAALPVCTRVEIDPLSGLDPPGRETSPTHVVIALRPLDGRGRFVQIAGEARVEALALPKGIDPASTTSARRIAGASLSPSELREAYREGFGGARYEVSLPLTEHVERSSSLVLRVELLDALTRRSFSAERIVRSRQ